MAILSVLLPGPQQFFDDSGVPLAGGSVAPVAANTSTPKTTYIDAARGTTNSAVITLDAAGCCVIFGGSGAYDLIIKDSLGNLIRTQEDVEDTFFTNFPILGNTLVTGARNVGPTYQILSTDNFVTVSTGPVLLPAATRGMPVGIQYINATASLEVRPAGSDTINQLSAGKSLLLPPSAAPSNLPTHWFLPDGVSNWRVLPSVASAAPIVGVGSGYALARGVHQQAAASDTVITGLSLVVAVVVSLRDSPTLKQMFFYGSIGNQSGAPAAGSILILSKKPTATNDVTPTASTDFTDNISTNWIALGTV